MFDLEKLIRENYTFKEAEAILNILAQYNVGDVIENHIDTRYMEAEVKDYEYFERIVTQGTNDYLRDVYKDLTAENYFRNYKGLLGQAETDIKIAFQYVSGFDKLVSEEILELAEMHAGHVDELAKNKPDWLAN